MSFIILILFTIFSLFRIVLPNVYNEVVGALYNISDQLLFVDLGDILRAGDCWRHGVNVYQPSSCLNGGVFNYSPLLLYVARLPLNAGDQRVGGIAISIVFMASLSLLPTARSWRELLVRCIAVISTTVWYAIEQGNLDILLFAAIVLGVWLVKKNHSLSILSYLLFGLAAAAKFYPAILFALGLRERLVRLIFLGAVTSGAGAIVLVFHGASILQAVSIIPKSQPFRATFGASDLFSGLELLHILPWRSAPHVIRPYYPNTSLLSGHIVQNILTALMSLGAIIWAWRLAKNNMAVLPKIAVERQVFLIAGALVVVFCFFAAQNVDYRSIYLLMLMPGLWDMAYPQTGMGEKAGRSMIVLILILLWEAAIRAVVHGFLMPLSTGIEEVVMIAVWLARELLWWWLIIELMALIIAFAHYELLRLNRELRYLRIKN